MFRNPQSGQAWKPPTAAQETAWNLAAQQYMQRQRLGSGNNPVFSVKQPDIVVTNNTGSDRRRGDVVQVGDLKLDDENVEQRQWLFEGDTPQVTNIRKQYAILDRAIANASGSDKDTGPAHLTGICPAYVNVISTGHNRAHIKNGEFTLTSGLFGEWDIIYKPASSTGEQMCAVRFAPAAPRLCVWLPSGETVPARSDDTMTRTSNELDVFTVVGEFGDSTLDLEPLVDDDAQQVSVHVYGFHNDTPIAGNRFLLIEPLDRNIPIVTLSPCSTDASNGE